MIILRQGSNLFGTVLSRTFTACVLSRYHESVNSASCQAGNGARLSGVDPEVALELMLAWNRMRCRPPLDDTEVTQVVASITRLHEANLETTHE